MLVEATGASAASVTGAIRQAAQKTGTSFDYLLATAKVESNLNPNAKAASSSAGGLFQFIEQTWLGTLKHAGPALGYGRYADAISKNSSGRFEVSDSDLRQKIFALRGDPTVNAMMAGALTKSNGGLLAARLGRGPTDGELYLAHFLGAAGAGKLIALAGASPQANASEVFSRAASANRSIFYNKQGEPRSVAQVYDLMVGRHNVARAQVPVGGAAVAARAPPPVAPASKAFPALLSALPTISLPPLAPLSLSAPQGRSSNVGSVFHGLFRTGERAEAVAPVVTALWGSERATPATQGAKPVNHVPRVFGGTLDLFRDNG